MRVVTWSGGRVSISDSVGAAGALRGADLMQAYGDALRRLTLGLARLGGNAIRLGPLVLIRLGSPNVTDTAVDWTIEGGLLAGAPGGHWRIESTPAHFEAFVVDYRPRLPRLIYTLTQLQVHLVFTRAYLRGLKKKGAARAAP